MDQGLDDGVVGGVHVGVEGKVALAVAIEGLVVVGGDDPVLPAEISEADPEHPPLTVAIPEAAAVEVPVGVGRVPKVLKLAKIFPKNFLSPHFMPIRKSLLA